MNRRDRRRHGKRDDGIEIIELTSTHARVLRALMEATEGVKGDYLPRGAGSPTTSG